MSRFAPVTHHESGNNQAQVDHACIHVSRMCRMAYIVVEPCTLKLRRHGMT